MAKTKKSKNAKWTRRFRIIKHNVLGNYYVWRGGRNDDGSKEQLALYKRGLVKYPHNLRLNRRLAYTMMDKKEWKQSQKYWKEVYRYYNYLKPQDFISYSIVLSKNKHKKQAFNILVKAFDLFPEDELITKELMLKYIGKKKIKPDLKLINALHVYAIAHPNYRYYDALLRRYMMLGKYSIAANMMEELTRFTPDEIAKLNQTLIDVLIDEKLWSEAIEQLKKFIKQMPENQFENQLRLAMIYQVVGDMEASNQKLTETLENYAEEVENDKKAYRKIIVFDNGDTRIELYKKLAHIGKAMITFDSLNMVWDEPSFAFRLLIKEEIDIIAIRKREHRGYQQDFTHEEFLQTVKPIIRDYQDVMAYGFSLGAYQVLYHAAPLNCRILAMSPRLSIHPEYGKPKVSAKHKLRHEPNFIYNDKIEPVIIYDPKNTIDDRFMTQGILPYFPATKVIEMPYAGHMVAPYMRDIGQLKSFVQAFINNEDPIIDRKKMARPVRHYFHLSRYCLKRQKYRWALDIVEKYLAFDPTIKDGIRLKTRILIEQELYDKAEKYLNETIEHVPKLIDGYLLLIDMYIKTNQLERAEAIVEKTTKKFGKRVSINKRVKNLKEAFEKSTL